MTGPGPGKVPLRAKVFLYGKEGKISVDADVYIHVKGWSLARVTHIDVEHPALEEFIEGDSEYCTCLFLNGKLIVIRRCPGKFSKLEVETEDFIPIGNVKSVCFVGKKIGGIFIGFKKEIIRKLEEIAAGYGVTPR